MSPRQLSACIAVRPDRVEQDEKGLLVEVGLEKTQRLLLHLGQREQRIEEELDRGKAV